MVNSLGPARGTGLAGVSTAGMLKDVGRGPALREGDLGHTQRSRRSGGRCLDRSLEAYRMNKASGLSIIVLESLIETLLVGGCGY
jgi:hypothetical protein